MVKYLFVFLLLGCSNITVNHYPKYDPMNPSIAVESDSGNGFCGGVWIDNDKILTAQHCVEDTPNNVYATNGFIKTKGLVIKQDDFNDLALIKTYNKSNYKAVFGKAEVGSYLTVIMPPGDAIKVKVVKVDYNWNGYQLDWIAPHGASGSPIYNSNGELVCIMTKQIPDVGSFCNIWKD